MIWLHNCPRTDDNYGPQVVEKGKQCPFCGLMEEDVHIGDRIEEKCPRQPLPEPPKEE
mgnify:CR=1 FL=1